MNCKHLLSVSFGRLFLLVGLSLGLINGRSLATDYTWDQSGGAPLNDGAGSWNATGGTNWFNGTTFGAWGNTTADTATFGVGSGAAGTITVGTVTTGGITFATTGSGNYTLSGGTISVADATSFVANQNVTISSAVKPAGNGNTIAVLTLDGTASNAVFSGVWSDNNGGHASSLVKQGTGTWGLSGSSSFSGTVTVNQGTLSLNTGNAFKNVTKVSVNTGGTLLFTVNGAINQNTMNVSLGGGTLSANTASNQSFGTLSLTGTSTTSYIDFQGQNAHLSFLNSTAAGLWGSGDVINVYNWGSNSVLNFGNASGLTVAQLGNINFFSGTGTGNLGTGQIASNGNVTPNGIVSAVPEPSTVLVGLGLCSLIGYRERRWFLRCRAARQTMFT